MEGFVRLRLRPWVRRALTRSLAIVPALVVLSLASAGQASAADERLLQLLVLSQVILSFQLPFAIIPLVWLTGDRRRMGAFASGGLLKALAWACALTVIGLCGVLIVLQTGKWAEAVEPLGWRGLWVYATVGPLALAVAAFLGWVALYPWLHPQPVPALAPPARPELPAVRYRRIGVAVEFTDADAAVLAHAAALARGHGAPLVLMHVVEGPGAAYYGPQTDDQESRRDRVALGELVEHLRREGLSVAGVLGYGLPAEELVRLSGEQRLDLLVLGTHGHRFLADLALGETVAPVLHRLPVPVLVVPSGRRGEPAAGAPAAQQRTV
jgi:manganese transport protein